MNTLGRFIFYAVCAYVGFKLGRRSQAARQKKANMREVNAVNDIAGRIATSLLLVNNEEEWDKLTREQQHVCLASLCEDWSSMPIPSREAAPAIYDTWMETKALINDRIEWFLGTNPDPPPSPDRSHLSLID